MYIYLCILPKVKKCEKIFALNVDIFKSIWILL